MAPDFVDLNLRVLSHRQDLSRPTWTFGQRVDKVRCRVGGMFFFLWRCSVCTRMCETLLSEPLNASETCTWTQWQKTKNVPFKVMRVRMTTGEFLFQKEIVFLTPNLKKRHHRAIIYDQGVLHCSMSVLTECPCWKGVQERFLQPLAVRQYHAFPCSACLRSWHTAEERVCWDNGSPFKTGKEKSKNSLFIHVI